MTVKRDWIAVVSEARGEGVVIAMMIRRAHEIERAMHKRHAA